MDLVSHPYYIVLDIIKGEIHAKKRKKKTSIINVYKEKSIFDKIQSKKQDKPFKIYYCGLL